MQKTFPSRRQGAVENASQFLTPNRMQKPFVFGMASYHVVCRERAWKDDSMRAAITLLICLIPNMAMGQAALEHHVWQDKRSFEPMSRTAQAITGPIMLSGNSHFAARGSKMIITFGNGKSAALTAVGASWREWDDADHGKVTAEVFRLDHDPGNLEQGNTLCGGPTNNRARYIVFHEGLLLGQTPLLGVAVFESKDAPWDINSPGLCGTFSFHTK